jgi:hypothetical protein
MKGLVRGLVLAAYLSCCGAALAQSGSTAPPPIAVAPTLLPPPPPSAYTKLSSDRATVGIAKIRLSRETVIDVTCQAYGQMTLQVIKQPSHGAVTIVDETDFPNYPATNARSICNTRKVPTKSAYYEARSGFIGIDTVVLLFSTSDGAVRQESYNINVLDTTPQ